MRTIALMVALVLVASPAHAQFGRLNDALNKAQKVKKLTDIKVTAEQERQIGQQVSDKLVETFGVYQDPGVTKYVTLVGSVLAQASPRPDLDWQFVVLDTDGVNAFAAPGGFIHVTRGLLGLIETEAELAGIMGHEIVHVTEKHTVNAIQKSNAVGFASDEVSESGGMTQGLVTKVAQAAYTSILDNKFSRSDESESDARGIEIANKVGYNPAGLSDVLTKLAARNADMQEPNGLFASHPVIKDRIAKIEKTIKDRKLTATATVAARYTENVELEAKPIAALALVPEGSRGLAGGEEKKDGETAKKDEGAGKSSGGGMLSRLTGGGKQAQQTQTVASAGARGGVPDRDAVGGPNKNRVRITIGAAEIAEFKKGIA
ncbi:MAG TPA: M48 family metalloprotease [Vicinamibacterales bacterium]|nr:M48 family metalloprotease [Vicinamibacterales bacterium]